VRHQGVRGGHCGSKIHYPILDAIANTKVREDPTPTKVLFVPDETFYCVAELSNATDDTKVRAVWTAVKVEGAKPDTKVNEAKTTSGSGQLEVRLTNNDLCPTGDYKVDPFLNEAKKPTKALTFKVQ